jgi:serine-type D-Ala-D-Ala carboxypeptidase (penicillin-binding protein 5/6)
MTRRYFFYFSVLMVIFFTGLLVKNIFSSSLLVHSESAPTSIPVSKNLPPPAISAKNVFILDTVSQNILFQLNPDEQKYPASTTKMMTALVALGNFPISQTITVTKSYPLGQNAGLKPGEQMTVEQLLYAMLIQSANDAAEILAENFPGGRVAFIQKMNDQAVLMHLTHTHFVNPTGLDEDGHYSSAADLSRLAQVVLNHPLLAKIVSTENAVVATNTTPHVLTNVNQLLGKVPGVLGVKTGFTDLAGQTLVTYVNRDQHPVIITILGSTDRFTDTQSLINWVYSNFHWTTQTGTLDPPPAHRP